MSDIGNAQTQRKASPMITPQSRIKHEEETCIPPSRRMPNRVGSTSHVEWSVRQDSVSVVELNESNILAALEEHGNRITWPRRELAATLARRTDSFSAEDVVAELPGLGRATIYRTIRLLVEAGILCKAMMPNGSPRYSMDDAFHHHHHLVCVSCGRIDEFRHPGVERVIRLMKHELGHEFIGHRFELYDRCDACRQGT